MLALQKKNEIVIKLKLRSSPIYLETSSRFKGEYFKPGPEVKKSKPKYRPTAGHRTAPGARDSN